MRSNRSIVIFALAPEEEGQRKLFAGGTGGEKGEALHLQLLDRAIATAAQVTGADVTIVTTGDLERTRGLGLQHLVPERLSVRLQEGRDFGDRLRNAVETEFLAGREQVVAIGTDTPELLPEHIGAAFAALAGEHSAVLGPSLDGGYYLIGLSGFSIAPFAGIRFGGHETAADTAAALRDAGYRVHTLPVLSDLDGVDDAVALVRRLSRSHRQADVALLHALLQLLACRHGRPLHVAAALASLSSPRALVARGPPPSP